jgi:O-antigen/teichoic acid export membrane protein
MFIKSWLQRARQSAAAWSFIATALRVGANVFVLPIVLRKLPADQFGVWVVFGTIGGLAALLDFGFEYTITRMTSYAWGGATKFVAFGIHQDDTAQASQSPSLSLLRDLIATLKAYYFYAGLGVLTLLAVGGGVWIWMATRQLEDAGSLRLAWVVFAGGCWLNFVVGRWPALLTGVGAVRETQVASIISLLFYYVVVAAGLFSGLGIWALVAGSVVMGFVARHLGKHFFKERVQLPGGLPHAHFHPELFQAIWPNAWRAGLVGVGGYLSVQSNTLICSAFLGLKTTAAYGLSFQLVNLLFGLCLVWVSVKLPLISALRQQDRRDEIADIFGRRMRLSLLSYSAGTLVILFVAPLVLRWLGSKTPLIATEQLAALAFIRLLELHQVLYATLVITENHNPFFKPSLIFGAATVVVSALLTPFYGLWGLILSMGLIQALFNDWWPVLRGLRGLGFKPGAYFLHHYLRPKAWLELF